MVDVTFKNVEKRFGNEIILPDVNLEIRDKEFLILVGPSGCGKSTMLNLVAGLEYPTGGKIYFGNQDVSLKDPKERNIAMVFQSYALYPHLSVYENMAFALRLAKESNDEIDKKVKNAAEILQISELMEKKPSQMSGGQRQRVALGRAIVREPSVFLFDEPLSNLDAKLRVEMRAEIIRLQKRLLTTLVYVTHDQVEAMSMADRIVILNKGVIQQVGTPFEVYYYPNNKFVAGFIGSPQMNFIDAMVEISGRDVFANFMDVKLKLTGKHAIIAKDTFGEGSEFILGIRPEHMFTARSAEGTNFETSIEQKEAFGENPSDENVVFESNVLVVEHLGASTHIMYQKDGEKFSVVMDGYVKAKMDERLFVRINEHSIHLFDKTTGQNPLYS